ncbi:trichohyalin-like [Actinia tenebrosa]|uniref:Trichohyalin-like n=1 Tax=Actinia tenebrosa TaxID=6105 RepID=A0A6P8IT10_ACTTE|nr:trichohyalin-like [Actinia tenebrosa]
MAGKKKKKKDKKNLSGSLSHIASQLVPSAIFAAVPRSASAPLSSTWPRSSASSPVARAVGEAGNVGFAFVGNINRSSSQAELERNQGEITGNLEGPHVVLPSTSQRQPGEDDPTYEAVEVAGTSRSDGYDKTTKFYHMRNDAKTENESHEVAKTGNGQNGDDHVYDDVVEDWQNDNSVGEPVYAKVDKTKKTSVLSQIQGSDHPKDDDYEGSGIEVSSSDEDLTDVTTNDEDSSFSSKTRPKQVNTNIDIQKEQNQNTKLHKTRRRNKDDDTSEESSSKNIDSLIAKHEKLMEGQGKKPRKSSDKNLKKSEIQLDKSNILNAPHEARTKDDHSIEMTENKTSGESESNLINKKRSSRKSSQKKKAQISTEEARLDDNTSSHTIKPLSSNGNGRPDKESRQTDRLGFEGISQNVGLSDISEDEESYLLRLSQSKFEHQRTEFEKENFNETLTDSFDTNLVEEPQNIESNNFDLTEASPVSLQQSTGSLHKGNGKSYRRNPESPDQNGDKRESNEKIFIQQQKHLEELIRQQENVYEQQAQQQKEQQKQTDRLVQQQQELQGQLKLLEEIQYDRVQGLSSAVSDHDVRIQKEIVEQQEQFLRSQQKQQVHYEQHQERILQQQENLCSQIRQLELQMRDVKSNISSLTPKDKDLAEIRWQEQEIIRLLNEQKHHQQQYEQLHKQQLQQMQDKELKFIQERQALQVQQDFLKSKMIEQEEKSKILEKELHNVSSKEKRHEKSKDSKRSQVVHTERYHDEVDAVPLPRKEAKKSSKTKKWIHDVLTDNSRLLEVNASLQQENAVLKQYSEALQKGSTGGSSLIMQQQIKELQEENKVLRETVHRVNVELSRYQTKYRQATAEDFPVMLSKTKAKEPSPWLVNTKFLAPLFLAYDDRLKEREDVIKTYDEELASFKARLMEIVKENQDLHMRLTHSKPDALDLDEWQQLQVQAKLVVEENELLMKQQDQQHKKLKELQRSHGQDVSKLSMRIATLESEKRNLETELEESRHNCANMSQKYKEMIDEEETKINVEAHLSMIDECRSVMEDLSSKKKSEIEDLESRLNVVQEEKQNLASSLADSNAQITQLTKELDVYKKNQRKLERKTLFLEKKLEHILEREVTAQQTLSEVLKVAEKTAEERDSFEEFAKSQELQRKKSKSLIHQGDLDILGLQEKLKHNKKKLNHKVASMTGRLNDKEKEVNKMKEDYEHEINRLRHLVREKQSRIETIMGERRIFDQQLDMVWKKADQDNQQMINTVRENQPTQQEQ